MKKPIYKKKRVWIIALLIVLAMFTPQIIDWIYPKEGVFFTRTTFGKEELLSFYGNFLALAGTIALGGLTLWQNHRFKVENDIAQDRLERLAIKANELEIINKIISMEKRRLEN